MGEELPQFDEDRSPPSTKKHKKKKKGKKKHKPPKQVAPQKLGLFESLIHYAFVEVDATTGKKKLKPSPKSSVQLREDRNRAAELCEGILTTDHRRSVILIESLIFLSSVLAGASVTDLIATQEESLSALYCGGLAVGFFLCVLCVLCYAKFEEGKARKMISIAVMIIRFGCYPNLNTELPPTPKLPAKNGLKKKYSGWWASIDEYRDQAIKLGIRADKVVLTFGLPGVFVGMLALIVRVLFSMQTAYGTGAEFISLVIILGFLSIIGALFLLLIWMRPGYATLVRNGLSELTNFLCSPVTHCVRNNVIHHSVLPSSPPK